jgi:hypothetical protein
VEGYQVRDEIQFRYLGWHAANLIGVWAKKGSNITVNRLCGSPRFTAIKDKPDSGRFQTTGAKYEETRKYFKDAKRRRLESQARARDQAIPARS